MTDLKLDPHTMHLLATESPLHAWTAKRGLGGVEKEPTDAMEMGGALGILVFEGAARDNKAIRIINAQDYRTNDAKQAREAARSEGRIPLLRHKFDLAQEIAKRVRAEIEVYGYQLEDGETEVLLEWEEEGTDAMIPCKGYVDWLRNDHQLFIELKTTAGSAHPDAVARQLLDGPGGVQLYAYQRGIETLQPDVAGRVEGVVIFAQTVEPFCILPATMAGSMREIMEIRFQRALEMWETYLAAGTERHHWPGYTDPEAGPLVIEAPAWAVNRELYRED